MNTTTHPFTGTVLIPVEQIREIVAIAVSEGIAAWQSQQVAEAAAAAPLPDLVPAALAAEVCGYKTAKSLTQWHGKPLNPIRQNNRRLFYKKEEVLKLRKKLMNQ